MPRASSIRWTCAVVAGAIAISIGFYAHLLFDGSLHGYDWQSHHFNYFDWVRESLRDYGTLPLFMNDAWITKNFLANAEGPGLFPLAWLLLWMPTDLYLKLLIVLFSAGGLIGMLALLRDVGVDLEVAVPAAVSFAFGGFFVSHLAVGHPWAMGGLVLPGLLCLYRRATLGSLPALWIAAALNASTILGGQHQPFIWQNMLIALFALAWAIDARSRFPLIGLLAFGLASFGLGAVKLLPMLAEFADYDPTMRVQGFPIGALFSSLLGFGQHPDLVGGPIAFEHGSGWWEYAFYIGPFAAAYIAFGVVVARGCWPLLVIGAFFFLLSIEPPASARAFGLWTWIGDLPVWRTQRGPSRFLFLTLFCITTVAAIGVQSWRAKRPADRRAVALFWLLAFAIGADSWWQSLPWQRAATGAPLVGGEHRPMPLQLTGTNGARAELVDFAPNRLVYRAAAMRDSRIRFPFRLAEGTREWRVDGLPAVTDRGKLAVDLPAGERDIVMIYRPDYFYPGVATSLATLGAIGISFARRRGRGRSGR